jgi:hypothetical protein
VGEVFSPIAVANYSVARTWGTAPPTGIDAKAITAYLRDKLKPSACRTSLMIRHYVFAHVAPFRTQAVYNNTVAGRIQSTNALAVSSPIRMMLTRFYGRTAVLSLALAAGAGAQSIVPDPPPTMGPAKPGLFDRIISNQKKDETALDYYERIERVETRKNPKDPAPASVKIARVIPSGTGMDRIPCGPDGQPTDAAAYRADLEKLEQALALIVSDKRAQRDSLEKYAKKRKDRNDLIDATRNAFLFTFLAEEPRGEHMLSKYKMEPNPAFKPTSRFTAIYTKVHGFVWIDEAAGELARIEGDVTEDIAIGLFLGKIYKGSHFMQERYETLPGVWFTSFSQYDFDGRKLFSSFSIHERSFYSNYRYVGPPKEALEALRKELGRADLGKPSPATAAP